MNVVHKTVKPMHVQDPELCIDSLIPNNLSLIILSSCMTWAITTLGLSKAYGQNSQTMTEYGLNDYGDDE